MEKVANDGTASGADLPAAATLPTATSFLDDVPDDLSPDELRTLARDLIGALRREDAVHRSLIGSVVAGGSLSDLCAGLVDVLDATIVVTTTDGRVIADAGSNPPLEEVYASEAFDRTGRLVVESEPVGIRQGDEGWTRRAIVRIVGGTSEEGRLAAFRSDRPLLGADIHILERAATVAALAMAREQAVSAVESKYRAEFLRDALSGRAGTGADAIAHADSLGWSLSERMVVVVAETDEDDRTSRRAPEEVRSLQQRFARAWTRALATRDARAPVMGFSQEVVALLAVSEQAVTADIMATVQDLVRVVRGDGGGGRRTFATGVSRPIAWVEDLPEAYAEALKAVAIGRQMQGPSAVMHFDQLGIYRLLAVVPDTEELRRFVTDTLGELATDENAENAGLRETLTVLLDTNLNVAEAARILFFHYNTLRYRIAKLERMLGPFTTDPELRLTLALALKVLQMRGLGYDVRRTVSERTNGVEATPPQSSS
jgi:purine catabolism regulator